MARRCHFSVQDASRPSQRLARKLISQRPSPHTPSICGDLEGEESQLQFLPIPFQLRAPKPPFLYFYFYFYFAVMMVSPPDILLCCTFAPSASLTNPHLTPPDCFILTPPDCFIFSFPLFLPSSTKDVRSRYVLCLFWVPKMVWKCTSP